MCHDENQSKDENFRLFYILTVIDYDGQTKPYNITSEVFLAKVDEMISMPICNNQTVWPLTEQPQDEWTFELNEYQLGPNGS